MSTALTANHSLPHGNAASKPPSRRTYGRKRATTPVEDSVSSLLVTNESPGRKLLDKFAGGQKSFLAEMITLGSDDTETSIDVPQAVPAEPRAKLTSFPTPSKGKSRAVESEEEDEEEPDDEAVAQEMEKMRRRARGEDVIEVQAEKETTPPREGMDALAKPLSIPLDRKMGFGSSSLTDIPSSQLSSRPAEPMLAPLQSSVTEEETMPIRKSGMHRATGKKRIIESDDDEDADEEDGDKTIQRISPMPPSRSLTPTLPADSSRSSSPSPTTRRKTGQPREVIAEDPVESDDQRHPPSEADRYLAVLAREEAEENAREASGRGPSVSDEVEQYADRKTGKQGKLPKIKPLNKKEKRKMHEGIEANRRNRAVDVKKEQKALQPMSVFFHNAAEALRQAAPKPKVASSAPMPNLTFGAGSSPKTSPSTRTPQGGVLIPDSSSYHKVNPELRGTDSTASIELTSSPTPHIAKTCAKAPRLDTAHNDGIAREQKENEKDDVHDDNDDEEMQSMDAVFAESLAKAKKAEKARQLAKWKEQALQKNLTSRPQGKAGSTSDDDLEIEPNTAPAVPNKIGNPQFKVKMEQPPRRGPDAKAVLNRDFGKNSPALTKPRQDQLRHAGIRAQPKETFTESRVDFAARNFNHANAKNASGGAIPAGMRKSKFAPVTAEQLAQDNIRRHQKQAEDLRKAREAEYGRVRQMPPRQTPDFGALIEASAKAEPDEEEESDADDDDFDPEEGREVDSDDGEADNGDGAADDIEYSGEEDEGEEDDEDGVEDEEEGTEGPEASKTSKSDVEGDAEEEDVILPVKRRPRASNRLALDSDDEESTPKAPRTIAAASNPPSADAKSGDAPMDVGVDLDLDLEGFGGSAEGGFSQLFEATQVNGESGQADAFAGLRALAPVGLVPNDAMLPGVDISATQAARDNALIAGEAEAAMASQPIQSQKKELYINDAGFFTQTKPADSSGSVETQWAKTRQALAGPSDILMPGIVESPAEFAPSSTEKDPASTDNQVSSPTRLTQTKLTRLRRRAEDETSEVDEDEADDEELPTESTPKAKNAFDSMMQAQRRQNRIAERKAASKSALVQEQAEESDDDDMIFGGPRGKDDEEDDEDDDGYLEELVNDEAVSEEEKNKQDELAAAKQREIEQADDAKREAEAKKIIEGQHRTKKRGQDFFSDEEDDEEGGGKRRKWSKKERRKRRLEQADGLEKLEGEENAFLKVYNEDLESDTETDEEPDSIPKDQGPFEESFIDSSKDMYDLIRERGQKNRGKDLSNYDETLDADLRRQSRTGSMMMDLDDDVIADDEEAESFSIIKRSHRDSSSASLQAPGKGPRLSAQASNDKLMKFIADESQTNRRLSGSAGVSVISRQTSGPTATRLSANRPPPRQSSTSSSASGRGILQSKGSKFA